MTNRRLIASDISTGIALGPEDTGRAGIPIDVG
jgi:hypothetical protein